MRQACWVWLVLGGWTAGGFAALGPATWAAAQDPAPAEEPAEAEPSLQIDAWNDAHSIGRSDVAAISWIKLLLIGLLFLLWVASGDWVNRDSQLFDTGYGKWNPILFFPFFVLLLLFAFPVLGGFANFILAAILLPIAYLAAYVSYVVIRNQGVELHQRVFTPGWFRYEVAYLGNKVGLKLDAERKAEYEKGAPVDLMAIAAEERTNQANLLTARQSPGYLLVKDVVAQMADRRADRMIFDFTQQAVMSRQLVDGVWHNGEAMDREAGDVMLAVMKALSNLDMAERRKKQSGKFGAKYRDHSYVLPLVSQGVKTGEQVMVDLLGGRRASFESYEQLGMRKKMAEQWAELSGRDRGLLLIAGMPAGGVTTLTDVTLLETDRLLRDFVSIEPQQQREREIENIDVATYDPAEGQQPSTILPALIRKYPNVYVLRDLSDTEAAKLLLDQIEDDRLVFTTVQAKDACEALLRMLQKKVPHREFAQHVSGVLCTRLIRTLCPECKVAYEPTPDLAKKLGLPPGKIEALYRTPKAEEIEKPCQECGGIGYRGRTGLFELLVVNDQLREILLKQPKLDLLRKAARTAGMRTFQEEGVLVVARGVTSLAELQRVLKL